MKTFFLKGGRGSVIDRINDSDKLTELDGVSRF